MTTTASVKPLPAPGSKLLNGSILLAGKTLDNGWRVVIAVHAGAGASAPFCVWKVDNQGNAHWGDYHRELRTAVAAYERRI